VTRNNVLYLIIGALVIAVAALGYELYQARKAPPEGVHIDIGRRGFRSRRNSEQSSFAVTSFESSCQCRRRTTRHDHGRRSGRVLEVNAIPDGALRL
jgi:hypothetical protein